jgi:hypothetical protein
LCAIFKEEKPIHGFRNHNAFILPALIAIAGLFLCLPVFAQTGGEEEVVIATILHPVDGSEVAPLDCLALIQIHAAYTGENHYYLILFDEQPVTARWDPDALTFSYYPNMMLAPGQHRLQVFMTVPEIVENRLVAESSFTVTGIRPPVTEEAETPLFDLGTRPPTTRATAPEVSVTGTATGDFFRLSGRTSVNAAFVTLDGLGSSQRQEPDNTTTFDLTGRGQTGDTAFDLRLFFTTDENKYDQPRDRYVGNVDFPDYGFGVGDVAPRFGSLCMDGMRVRGALAWGTLGPVSLSVTSGEVRRGTQSRYDSTGRLLRRGFGERSLWAARATLWQETPFSISFSYLTGTEDPSDTANYGDPGDNTVRSVDFTWRFSDNGSLAGAMAESDYDFDDPEEEDVEGARAREAVLSYNLGDHALAARWQLIEPGFTSLGKSYVQDDRESWGIEDRINISRGMLTGRLYYERYNNNVNDTLSATTTSNRYGGQISYRFAMRGPSLSLGWGMQTRANDIPVDGTGRVDELTETITIGGAHSFDAAGARWDLRADWRRTDRSSDVSVANDNKQDAITIRLTSRWTSGFQLDMMYGNNASDYPGRDTHSDIDRYSVQASYTPQSRAYTCWGRWESIRSSGDRGSGNSDRETIELGMRWNLGDDLALEASLLVADFNDDDNDASDFQEHTFRIILTQMLD